MLIRQTHTSSCSSRYFSQIFSVKCARITYNGIHLEAPHDDEEKIFWVDFNLNSVSFDAQIPGENDYDFLEVIYPSVIKFVFVESYALQNTTKSSKYVRKKMRKEMRRNGRKVNLTPFFFLSFIGENRKGGSSKPIEVGLKLTLSRGLSLVDEITESSEFPILPLSFSPPFCNCA